MCECSSQSCLACCEEQCVSICEYICEYTSEYVFVTIHAMCVRVAEAVTWCMLTGGTDTISTRCLEVGAKPHH